MELPPPAKGDVYKGNSASIPDNLSAARNNLMKSDMLLEAMGEDVIQHYSRCAEWEIQEFERVVTDWEVARGFEKA